ncbi:hypothetical protein [Sulfurimonas sp. C5]|uniref:hypothetical protein n=1 Tax=Sulfurimonas sp. C5 TaxID=3036947 RepID=UPI002457B272|nr:hypothetical protein [Sulfurimonas sp. C5]MDH4943530.1 hypothetical protein [Sulfurimonas sp. C5]
MIETILGSSGLTLFILWISKNWILTRLTKAVQHEYDTKLTLLKNNLQQNEKALNVLRNGALENSVYTQKLLYEHKLKATHDLWDNIISLAPLKSLSTHVFSLNYNEMMKLSEQEPEVQDFFKKIDMLKDRDIKEVLDITKAQKSRPFVSHTVWALFSAYHAILQHDFVRYELLKIGTPIDMKDSSVFKVVKVALPEHEKYIEQYGESGLYHLIQILEDKILTELKQFLQNTQENLENIERANEILNTANKLYEENNKLKNED